MLRSRDTQQHLPLQIDKVCLPGRFNMENVAAGILAAVSVGGDSNLVAEAAQRFEGLPHRLELAAQGNGIRYYNDSYATRPEAAIAALSAFDGPLSLIMGGSEKHADFSELVLALVEKSNVVQVGLIGATASRMEEAIAASGKVSFCIKRFDSLEEAMEDGAAALSGKGTLLMAPACASFGMFTNYKVRGERFRAKATLLAKKQPM